MIFKRFQVISKLSESMVYRFNSNYVPKHEPVQLSDTNTLNRFIKEHSKILVLTGIPIKVNIIN